jgi:hypothetical protein
MKLVALFLVQGHYQKLGGYSGNIFLELFSDRNFHILLRFLNFVDSECYNEATLQFQNIVCTQTHSGSPE